MATKPTHEQLSDEIGFESVLRKADDGWRHGCDIYEVFQRLEDDTYWAVNYRLSTDGETNELRQGECDITQVRPVATTVIKYEAVPTTD